MYVSIHVCMCECVCVCVCVRVCTYNVCSFVVTLLRLVYWAYSIRHLTVTEAIYMVCLVVVPHTVSPGANHTICDKCLSQDCLMCILLEVLYTRLQRLLKQLDDGVTLDPKELREGLSQALSTLCEMEDNASSRYTHTHSTPHTYTHSTPHTYAYSTPSHTPHHHTLHITPTHSTPSQ